MGQRTFSLILILIVDSGRTYLSAATATPTPAEHQTNPTNQATKDAADEEVELTTIVCRFDKGRESREFATGDDPRFVTAPAQRLIGQQI